MCCAYRIVQEEEEEEVQREARTHTRTHAKPKNDLRSEHTRTHKNKPGQEWERKRERERGREWKILLLHEELFQGVRRCCCCCCGSVRARPRIELEKTKRFRKCSLFRRATRQRRLFRRNRARRAAATPALDRRRRWRIRLMLWRRRVRRDIVGRRARRGRQQTSGVVVVIIVWRWEGRRLWLFHRIESIVIQFVGRCCQLRMILAVIYSINSTFIKHW